MSINFSINEVNYVIGANSLRQQDMIETGIVLSSKDEWEYCGAIRSLPLLGVNHN